MIEPTKLTGRLGNIMFQYAFLYSYARDNNIDIYMQDEKHFEKYKGAIKWIFSQDIGPTIDRVSIHVRRGDYVQPPFNQLYIDLSQTHYYEQAIDNFPNEKFLIFSDDINWCKNFFIGEKFEFSEGKTEVEDMNLMASCKHNIIANSTFSWWSAYLNPNEGHKVVCPKEWFYEGVNFKTPTLLDEWIKI